MNSEIQKMDLKQTPEMNMEQSPEQKQELNLDQSLESEMNQELNLDQSLESEMDQEMCLEQDQNLESEPDWESELEQQQEAEQEPVQYREKYSWTENLPSILAGAAFAVIVAVSAVFAMNGLLIKAKGADENVTEVSEEDDALTSENVAIALAEDLLAAQGESSEDAALTDDNLAADTTIKHSETGDAVGGQSRETVVVQEESEGEATAEETDLLEDFVDRYGTVIPKNMTSSECIEALAALAEQYPEFEEIYENWEEYPMVLLIALCNNPEMIDFALGYPDADTETAGELTQAEADSDFPYYLQWDSRWGYLSYGETNIGLSGCGPTCLSMVIVKLTGNAEASPAVVAEYAMEHGYYISGSGTAWSLMTTGAAHFGITGTALSSSISEADLLKLLEEGCPVICSVKPGDFTKGGHFIVLAGVEDGLIRVYDPNSVERSSRLWDYETLIRQVKKLWVFEAAE